MTLVKLGLIESWGAHYVAHNIIADPDGFSVAQRVMLNHDDEWLPGGRFPADAKVTPLPTDVPGTVLLSGAERESARCEGYIQGKQAGLDLGQPRGEAIGRRQAIDALQRVIENEVASHV